MRQLLFVLLLILLVSACNSPNSPDSQDSELILPELVIVGEIRVFEHSGGKIGFSGEIKNIGSLKACTVWIEFTMKDSASKIIGTDGAVTNPSDLAPGQIGSFTCYT